MSIVRTDKKIPAGILAILLGSCGIHKFFLGYPKAGLTMLGLNLGSWVLALVGFPFMAMIHWYLLPLIGVIEGVIYLTRSDSDFYREYVIGRKPWF